MHIYSLFIHVQLQANRIRLHALLIGVVYLLCAIIALLLSFPGIFGSLEAIKATVIIYYILDASSLGTMVYTETVTKLLYKSYL